MTFYANPGINADHMKARDGRLCRLEGAPANAPLNIPPASDNPNTWGGYVDPPSFPKLYGGKKQ